MRKSVWNRFGCMLIVLSMLAGCLGAAPRRSFAAEAEPAEESLASGEASLPIPLPEEEKTAEDEDSSEQELSAGTSEETGNASSDSPEASAGEETAESTGEQTSEQAASQEEKASQEGEAAGNRTDASGEASEQKEGEEQVSDQGNGTEQGSDQESGTSQASDQEKSTEESSATEGQQGEQKEKASGESSVPEDEVILEEEEDEEPVQKEKEASEVKDEEEEEKQEEEKEEEESAEEEVSAFAEEGPAKLEEGKIRYGEHSYEIREGQLYRDDELMEEAGSNLDRLVVSGDILYAVNAETEEWYEVDRSMAPEAEGTQEENNVPLHSHVIAHPENEIKVYRFARLSLRVNTAAACGILANIYAESSFDPHASCIDTNGLTSYGICQWNGGRFTRLRNYCETRGLDYTTLEAQLDYLAYELRGVEQGSFMLVKSVPDTADGAWEAGYNWARYFERCAARFHQGRADYARDHYWEKAPEWSLEAEEETGEEDSFTDYGEVLAEDIPENGLLPHGIWISGVQDQLYDGEPKTQSFRVYYGNHLAEQGTEYEISYKNNVNAYSLRPGDPGFWALKAPQALVRFFGDYSGSKAFYFTIDPVDLSGGEAEELLTVYNGKRQTPLPLVTLGGRTLKYGRDYTIPEYSSDSDTDLTGSPEKDTTRRITLTGIGNYTGALSLSFSILTPKDGKGRTRVSMKELSCRRIAPLDYTGEVLTPKVSVYYPDKEMELRQGADYTVEYLSNRDAGTALCLVKGLADEGKNRRLSFVGTLWLPFTIRGTDIAGAQISGVSGEGYVYTGESVYPQGLTLTMPDGSILEEERDYTLKLEKDIDVGEATAQIIGAGGYTGKKSIRYAILPKDIATVTVNEGRMLAAPYAKGGIRPVTRLRDEGRLLEEGTDYTVEVENHTQLYEDRSFEQEGAPAITITGRGNYSGELKLNYLILQKDFSRVQIKAPDVSRTGEGEGLYSEIRLIDTVSGRALTEGVDYEELRFYVVEQGEEEELIPLEDYGELLPGTVIRVEAVGKGAYTSDPINADYHILPEVLEETDLWLGKEEEPEF